jgi:hypothetical protein
MQKPRQPQTRRRWPASRASSPPPAARAGWRNVPKALPFAGGRGRPAPSRGRFGATLPRRSAGRGPVAGRRERSSGTSVMVLRRGLLGQHKRSRRSRKAPAALIAALAGLGAAGAVVMKRRRSEEDQPTAYVPPTEPAATTTSAPGASRPAGAA